VVPSAVKGVSAGVGDESRRNKLQGRRAEREPPSPEVVASILMFLAQMLSRIKTIDTAPSQ
jgi:hypothetical protein